MGPAGGYIIIPGYPRSAWRSQREVESVVRSASRINQGAKWALPTDNYVCTQGQFGGLRSGWDQGSGCPPNGSRVGKSGGRLFVSHAVPKISESSSETHGTLRHTTTSKTNPQPRPRIAAYGAYYFIDKMQHVNCDCRPTEWLIPDAQFCSLQLIYAGIRGHHCVTVGRPSG